MILNPEYDWRDVENTNLGLLIRRVADLVATAIIQPESAMSWWLFVALRK
jgi:hypothetical protein